MRSLKVLTLSLVLIGALPLFGGIYIKFPDIDGEVTEAGWEKWIELNSLQNADGSPAPAMLESGRVRLSSSSGTFMTQLLTLCQSNRPLGTVQVGIDGRRQVLKNARFTECPAARGSMATAVLEFGEPTAAAKKVPLGWDQKKNTAGAQPATDAAFMVAARILGLKKVPVSIRLEKLTIDPNGTSATVLLGRGDGTFALPPSGTVLPQLVLELDNGKKWTFYKVTMKDLLISSATARSSQPNSGFTMNFTKVEGPADGFGR